MASFIVTTLTDVVEAGDGVLSLREALALANGNGATPDTITFAAGLAGGTLFLTSGQLEITSDGIAVDGDIDRDGSADITIDADSAAGLDDAVSPVFVIGGGDFAGNTLNGLGIQDGHAVVAIGGDIVVGGALTLTNSTVSGGRARFGGGIYAGNYAALTLINSTVSGNNASYGGGISGAARTTITLTNSTISGNSGYITGGGIFTTVYSAIMLTNSTVSGNSGAYGGGIAGYNHNTVTLNSSTVTGNSGQFGGGISNRFSGVTTLTNSIVAGNAATNQGDDLFGGGGNYDPTALSDLVFTGGNIIGSGPVGFASVTGVPPILIDGTSEAALETVFAAVAPDPDSGVLSGVLADNGGPVETVAITTGGIAHNAGDDTVLPPDLQDLDHDGNIIEPLSVDARGLPRVVGAHVDIGAFEAGDGTENHPPAAVDDLVAIVEDATSDNLWPALLSNDTDPDAGDSLAISSVDTNGTQGHVNFNAATQLLEYVADADAFDLLAPGATTTDSFSYTIVDGGGLTSTAIVTVEVTGGSDNQPRVRLGNGDDSRTGAAGEAEDSIFGENGDDSLSGLGGADTLDGGRGADTLNGGDGVDWLFGRRGDDSLAGGSGPDVFVLARSGGDDTVTGFLVGTDHLHLDGVAARHATLADVDHDGGANDLVIRLSSGSVTLLDTGAVANWETQLFV